MLFLLSSTYFIIFTTFDLSSAIKTFNLDKSKICHLVKKLRGEINFLGLINNKCVKILFAIKYDKMHEGKKKTEVNQDKWNVKDIFKCLNHKQHCKFHAGN